MKKYLVVCMLISISSSCLLSVVDEIGIIIELLQPDKLKQIFSHNLVLKKIDKEGISIKLIIK